jgi:hypothetical protein
VVRTWIAVGLFGALLAYVLLVEVRREPRPNRLLGAEEATSTPVPLLEFDPGDLTAVQWRTAGRSDAGRTLRIERRGDGWTLIDPARASETTLDDPRSVLFTLEDLARLQARQVLTGDDLDRAAYGLEPAALVVTVETRAGEKAHIEVGRETPDGTAFYVQLPGDPRVYLVPHYKLAPFFEWLDSPPSAYGPGAPAARVAAAAGAGG